MANDINLSNFSSKTKQLKKGIHMNVIKAAQDTIDFAHKDKCSIKIKPQRHKYGMGYNHAIWMLEEIVSGNVQNDKANRWLGYAQALLVNFITLENLKDINKQ